MFSLAMVSWWAGLCKSLGLETCVKAILSLRIIVHKLHEPNAFARLCYLIHDG